MEKIVAKIKQKFELKNLPDDLVEKTLNEYLSKNHLSIPKSEKELKLIIKEVRAELRRYAGQYASKANIKKRERLLQEGDIENLLKEHASTRERIHDYDLIKGIISKLKPMSILDLGCGLNPIALAQKGIVYHSYDINDEDLKIVRQFFRTKKIEGGVHQKDIRQEQTFPKVDLCIIFKVLDILGDNRNEISKRLLSSIDTKNFIVSFATRTLTGKPMNSPYRRWFERILSQLNYNYEVKRTKQELIYIIKK